MAELDLHKPLDRLIPPTLEVQPLSPDLAVAALTLHGDYYRQLQSKSNSAIFWHSSTQAFMIAVLGMSVMYQYHELWSISDTFGEFWSLFLHNKYLLTNLFPSLIFVAGIVGLCSFLITDELRTVSDRLGGDAYIGKLFKFPLRLYANQKELTKLLKEVNETASRSTDMVIYRKSPIAVVTVIPDAESSNDNLFACRISGLHVRKSYKNAGLEQDLLALALKKAHALADRYISDNKIKNVKIVITADAYSFDSILERLYVNAGFHLKHSTTDLDPFSSEPLASFLAVIPDHFIKRFFGMYRRTYQLELEQALKS